MDPSSLSPPPSVPPPPPPPLPPPPPPSTSTSVVNPSPPTLNHNHPPYAEMICAAISALKERDGSSKRAIAKYIEKAYPNLPTTHSTLLTHHLKRLKNAGHLVMVKKSYKLPPPRSDPASNILPSNDAVYNYNNSNPTAAGSAAAVSLGRGRGRPRKTSSGASPGLAAVTAAGVDKPKRGRGRPKKTDGQVQRGSIKRKAGRPKKPKTVKGQQQAQQDQLNNVTVSYVTGDANVPMPAPVPVPVPVPGGARRRGRPKKVGSAVVGAAAGGKPPRRRPAKQLQSGSGRRIGRPVGRPKKNLSSALTEAAQAQAQAIADLKRKLEFFQSKVKQVVTVLKPQISSESQISAGAAIQELEGLVSMDINIPLKEDAQPLVLQS